MKKVTFLGPIGATFSHEAYVKFSQFFDIPKVFSDDYIPSRSNKDILKHIQQHGGYGVVAMETLAEGRVIEPLESFIELLQEYSDTNSCPFRILGAIQIELHFCLMVRPGILESTIDTVLAHSKALGACKNHIADAGFKTIHTESNGEAARLVAEDDVYAGCAALGPYSAAEKYGLQVLHHAYEDAKAYTTFFLIGPTSHQVKVGTQNHALIVFRLPHKPGALVSCLKYFDEEHINLVQIHSLYVGNHTYDFAIEVEVSDSQLEALDRAVRLFNKSVDRSICFGPFGIALSE